MLRSYDDCLKFLATNSRSPYNNRTDTCDRAQKKAKFHDVHAILEEAVVSLNPLRKTEKIKLKMKARASVIDATDMDDLLDDTRDKIRPYLRMNSSDLCKLTRVQIIEVRDLLIIIPAVRLGNRSTEFGTMTLEEAYAAECINVPGLGNFWVVCVADYKNSHTGVPATIAYADDEYQLLLRFIDHLRPRFGGASTKSVFLTHSRKPSVKAPSAISNNSIWKLFRKLRTRKGKSICTRVGRYSVVTESRKQKYEKDNIMYEIVASQLKHTCPVS